MAVKKTSSAWNFQNSGEAPIDRNGSDPSASFQVNISGHSSGNKEFHKPANYIKTTRASLNLPRPTADSDLTEALSLLALEKTACGHFVLVAAPAEIFRSVYPECFDSAKHLSPQVKFPFLENFLFDAQQAWDKHEQSRVYSGPWIELNEAGIEFVLEASAVKSKGRNLLTIQILGERYQNHHQILQVGREGLLLKSHLQQEVKKRTKEIREREEEIALRLICAADSRDDGETGAHIRRIGLYSELMARHLGWPEYLSCQYHA